MKLNPVGIFDSGVGGLSIARTVRNTLPNEDIIYIADSLHAPYGDKSIDYIFQRSSCIIDFLLSKKVKAIVVACNTVTVSAIDRLRENYRIPIIGVEPGIKPAISMTKTGTIAVLATKQTVNSDSYMNLLKRFTDQATIETQACPGLVELIEKQQIEELEIKSLLEKYVIPLLDKGADTFVLGCTHYVFLSKILRDIIGSDFNIVNTSQAVALETSRRLSIHKLLSTDLTEGSTEFYSTGIQENTAALFEMLWGEQVSVMLLAR